MGEIGDTPLESEFFDIDPQRGVQVTLMAHEVVFIPFAFLSLEPRRPAPLTSTSPRKTRPSGRGGAAGDGGRGDNAAGEGGAGMAERSVAVAFVSASHGHVVSVVQVGTCGARSRVFWSAARGGAFVRVDYKSSGWVVLIVAFFIVRKDRLRLSDEGRKTNCCVHLRHQRIDIVQCSPAVLLYYCMARVGVLFIAGDNLENVPLPSNRYTVNRG